MSEDEGTPMEGPLPLELQQIRADTQREEAALAAAKAALAAQRRKSEVSECMSCNNNSVCKSWNLLNPHCTTSSHPNIH